MALTEYDRKHLTNKQQQQIQIATTAYNKAKEKGDKAGMEKAAADAAAVRNAAGYQTDSSGNYTGAYTPAASGGSNKNSQYTNYNYTIGSDYGKQQAQNMGIGTTWTATDGSVWTKENDGTITVDYKGQKYKNAYQPTDLGILGGQQVDAKVPYQTVEQTMYDRLNKIANNPELAQYANDGAYWKMYNYIQDQKRKEEYENNLDQFNQDRPEDYQSKYDPQIDALLNEILTREDFSYDVANDPLYQQYANMYRREGDRAMRETMAEAAAGAGGMNTYAVTAAQQANNYYNSMLNDKIPELYQLAYDKHLREIDQQIKDMGLLQNMDATQYGRYRDTMADWRDDRNFALGLYKDAVAQDNWNKNFDFNAMVDNRNFGYEDFWNNKNFNYNDEWKNKDYADNRADIEYERNQAEEEEAKATIKWYIENGVSTDAIPKDLIEKSGFNATAISQMVDYFKQQQAPKATTSRVYTPEPKVVDPEQKVVDPNNTKTTQSSADYAEVAASCGQLASEGNTLGATAYAREAFASGLITQEERDELLKKYEPLFGLGM